MELTQRPFQPGSRIGQHRSHTLTRVRRQHQTIAASLVDFTDNVGYTKKACMVPDVPICVIPFESRYIILDGNHRFQADLQLARVVVNAWILSPSDREIIYCEGGDAMPWWIGKWIDEACTFEELLKSAIAATIPRRSIGE